MLRKASLLAALFAACSCNTSPPPQELRSAGAAVLTIPAEPMGPDTTGFVVCAYGDNACPQKHSVPVGGVVLGSYQRDDVRALVAPAVIEAMLWSGSASPAPRWRSQGEGGR